MADTWRHHCPHLPAPLGAVGSDEPTTPPKPICQLFNVTPKRLNTQIKLKKCEIVVLKEFTNER